jgi:hypothetical protein
MSLINILETFVFGITILFGVFFVILRLSNYFDLKIKGH